MNARTKLESRVQRWVDAGVIDTQAATRILSFESKQEDTASLRWPVLLAMVFGGILLAAGITLFVAAHWDELSPAIRYSLMLFMVAALHAGGALVAAHFPALSTTLHALGTSALGAAIFLSAQIFNLQENWASGILLWALGAAAGYLLLRDWVQAAFVTLLVPAWLIGQWSISTENYRGVYRPITIGCVSMAICYLSASSGEQTSTVRRTLMIIGSIALLPCVGIGIALGFAEGSPWSTYGKVSELPFLMHFVGWTVAIAVPLLLSWLLRGRAAWINLLWAIWAYALILSAVYSNSFLRHERNRNLTATLALYGLCAIGSIGLVAWGLYERRRERVNLGVAAFALSVLFFYFDSFMGKLGRSASLLLLGVLCLGGGYALEVARRRLMVRMELPR